MELWRICRVLDNPIRFALLRDIALSPQHALNVLQVADRARQKKSVTSLYLKQLADAGLLSVERKGCYTVCSSNHLQRSPLARLQLALADFFAADPEGGRDGETLAKIRALSHHGRVAAVREISKHEGGIRFDDLSEIMGVPHSTLYRQLGTLIEAEIVTEGSEETRTLYRIAQQPDGLLSVLVSLALDCRLDQSAYYQ